MKNFKQHPIRSLRNVSQGAPGADADVKAPDLKCGEGEQPKSDKKDDDVVDADFKKFN